LRRRRRGEGSLEYWIRAVERARRAGGEAAREALRLWRRLVGAVEEHAGELLPGPVGLLVLERGTPAWEGYRAGLESRLYGVDSSRTRPLRLGFRFVSFVSAAAVWVEAGGGAGVEGVWVEDKLLPEEARPEHAALELELEMFRLEAAALTAAAGKGPVMLDGPIVDPPGLSRLAEAAGLSGKYRSYLEARARAASRALAGGGLVGYAKRLRGRVVAAALEGEAGGLPGGAGDSMLASALALVVTRTLRVLGACQPGGPGGVVVSRPVTLDPARVPDAPLYEGLLGGARLYTALIVPGACSGNTWRAARIEFAARPGEDPGRLAAYYAGLVEAALVPGAWIPQPVLLAHRACTIRGRESLRLLREAATRYALEALRAGGPLGGELEGAFRAR
jgi:hypothetical protein